MARIIPGVEVTVVKDVVPPQLAPAGVLGLVGLTELAPAAAVRAASWSAFVGALGRASAYSLPEAKQALANGVFELVIAPVAGVAESAKVALAATAGAGTWDLVARAPGPWANGLTIRLAARGERFDLEIRRPGARDPLEVHRNLTGATLADRLAADSAIVTAKAPAAVAGAVPAPKLAALPPGTDPANSTANDHALAGGKDASGDDYAKALRALEDEPDVDLVLVAPQDFSDLAKIEGIYAEAVSHCERLSRDGKGRIGFGQVPPDPATPQAVKTFVDMASPLISDRFVLTAPYGVAGAVAGRVGSLSYFQSPTFKLLTGLGGLARALTQEEQGELLKGNVVPVVNQRGRGIFVLRGLTTDGDQISVRRVADRAVRGVQMLGDLFIGRLNNEDGRGALKQKLIEFLVQMEKDGAIVPSTDGKDPSHKVDVYSSQADFAQGIVRVDIAVRPVRAIDFIYATILVQV
ncbi:phage tail sheath subtilisin-like domain-containing protein [uncultured Thiodictyon sp.]|uniref:phage tail sheath subtilisin-like domain-containing protein n=1 Tax=uncultured Thiodictyon sp. TaxID=1846217 RepID=UPI0025D3C7D3|nr:phage tail sheath subtilisin-like domain-containing protein [uncultured Thiodictyon sp.]